ncbi:YybH family protein [Streptomonospora nanhaiensis]|uniref:Ketosteroid isomerase-like protein n=1 Tax=Streptomonospora nanhaiensis TaxID=1323731 RepID=A0A853BSA2_9ACTN|nr:nuclear transport factor 2 family protein [Streptomonospora nanhaiensis]MBV2363815.1 nuclear transport factor 2 family protein [Streptomonospora nanhaiensis]MBX9388792.1 nuclear transport factor 2 family protein [Streptomonospora nanhaiensis]NYI97605.1 ketosteroid isomerase-like protein [Streptomonospora nanhaiensis]
MAAYETEIRELLDRRADACAAKDVDRLMSLYSPGVVYHDVVPPLQFVGEDAVRRNFVRWFGEYDGPISLETHELSVAVGGGAAFAHMLHLDSGTRKNGVRSSIWVRSTVGFRRTGGRWLITHEHISVPVDPRNMRAWFPPEKWAPKN